MINKPLSKTRRTAAFSLTEMTIVLGIAGAITSGIWMAYTQVSQAQKVEKASQEIRFIVNKVRALTQINPGALSLRVDPGCTVRSRLCSTNCVPPSPFPIGFAGCTPTTGPGCVAPCTDPAPGCVDGTLVGPSDSTTVGAAAQIATSGIFPSEMVAGDPVAGFTVSSPWGNDDVKFNMSVNTDSCAAGGGANAAAALAAFAGLLPGQSFTANAVPATNFVYTGSFNLIYGNPTATVPVSGCVRMLNKISRELIALGITSLRIGNFGPPNPPTAAVMTLPNISGWCSGPGTANVTITMTFPIQN